MFDCIFEDGELKDILCSYKNTIDPWIGTMFEGYVKLSIHAKGKFGERFINKYMMSRGATITNRTSVGHDEVIDGIPTEYKFSLCNYSSGRTLVKDCFFINHVSIQKDWERLIFVGINPVISESRILWFTKKDFISMVDDGIFVSQQGGKNVQNDDYKLSGNIDKLLTSKYVNLIDSWEGLGESNIINLPSTLDLFFNA